MKPKWISRIISPPLGFMLFLAGPAWAQPDWVKQERQSTLRRAEPIRVGGRQRGRAIVDWQQGYIQVTTRATADPKICVNIFQCRSLADRAARTLAYVELTRIIKGVNVTASTILRDELIKVSAARTFVRGFIRGARQIGETRFREIQGTKHVEAEVSMGVLINGGLTRGILKLEYKKPPIPPKQTYRPKTFTVKLAPPPPPPAAPPARTPSQVPAPKKKSAAPTSPSVTPGAVYTGVIIDASGLGARPALVAKLRTPDLKVFYGTHLVPRELAMNFGLAGYAGTAKQARSTHKSRIGESPLVVKGLRAHGTRKADIVLSEQDSQRVVLADLKGKFLQKAKVVIVINK